MHLATEGHLASIYTAVPSRAFGPLLLLSHGDEFDETYPGLHLATDGHSALSEIALVDAISAAITPSFIFRKFIYYYKKR